MEKQYDGYKITFAFDYKGNVKEYTIEVNKNWLKVFYGSGVIEKLLLLRGALEQRKIEAEYDFLYVNKVSLYVIENGEAIIFEEQNLWDNTMVSHRIWSKAYKSIFY